MKKSVIAAAVAAVLAAPVALADVSISGGLQAELVSHSGDAVVEGLYAEDAAEAGSVDSGRYGFLKFAASEDLGDGMKALAVYNMDIAVDNVLGTRDAFVGLSGGFGTVLAGKLATPYKSSTVGWDPMLATFAQARGAGGMSDAQNGYATNALAYANNFGGVKLVAAIVLDEGADPTDATKTNGENAMSVSVNAPVGPVEVAVAYVTADKFSNISNLGLGGTASTLEDLGMTAAESKTLDTLSATKVGVKWVSGAITVAGQYEMLSIGKDVSALGAVDIDPTVLYVTGTYQMGNNSISAGYGMTDWDIDGVDDTTYMSVAFNHAFSKNTRGYVGYRATDYGDIDATAVGAGLRISF